MMMRTAVRVVLSVVVLTVLLQASGWAQDKVRLVGSGASFPFPLYSAWFKDYGRAHPTVIVDYQAKGSGAGIQDFINRTVDFAASDAAMTDEDIAKVEGGAVLLPMTAGEIVLTYNLPGVKELKLSRDVYPDIFLGKIAKWSDPRIAAANPGVTLPDLPITVVRRSDSSGTTFVFTKHLSAVSQAWKDGPGTGTTVQWPQSDKSVAAPKNDGVTATVKQTPGAIGYIEYGYAFLTKADTALLQNKAGNYVTAGAKSGEVALAAATLPANLIAWLPDPEGADAYPITTFTWMLFYKKQDAKKAEVLRELVDYCLSEGQKLSESMGYIPLPSNLVERIRAASKEIR